MSVRRSPRSCAHVTHTHTHMHLSARLALLATCRYDNPLRGSAYGALMLGKGEEVEILNALDADWWEV